MIQETGFMIKKILNGRICVFSFVNRQLIVRLSSFSFFFLFDVHFVDLITPLFQHSSIPLFSVNNGMVLGFRCFLYCSKCLFIFLKALRQGFYRPFEMAGTNNNPRINYTMRWKSIDKIEYEFFSGMCDKHIVCIYSP